MEDAYTYLIGEAPDLLTIAAASQLLQVSKDHIRRLIQDGTLESHQYPATSRAKRRPRPVCRITRRSLLLYLAQSASIDPHDLERLIEAAYLSLSAGARKRLCTRFAIANSNGLCRPPARQSN